MNYDGECLPKEFEQRSFTDADPGSGPAGLVPLKLNI